MVLAVWIFLGLHFTSMAITVPNTTATSTAINSLIPPVKHLGEPLYIDFEFIVQDVNTIRELNMDFTVDFVLRERWTLLKDSCLEYSHILKPFNLSDRAGTKIIVPGSQVRKFWIPDTVVSNAKQVLTTSGYSETLYFEMATNDTCLLTYKTRKQAIVGCNMDFHQYPNDLQRCPLRLRSYSYPSDILRYEWVIMKDSLFVNPEVSLLQQELTVFKDSMLSTLLDVEYSYVMVNFVLERRLLNSIVQLYIPSGMIVVLSWFSFWMGFDAIPARISLCITSLLTIVTQSASARLSLPRISYICGMDVWLLSCTFYIFLTLLEFTLANNQRKRNLEKNQKVKAVAKPTTSPTPRRHLANSVKMHPDNLRFLRQTPPRLTIRLRPVASSVSSRPHEHQGFVEIAQPYPYPYPYFHEAPLIKAPLNTFGDTVFKNSVSLTNRWNALDLDHKAQVVFPCVFFMFNFIYWPVLIFRKF